jgi:hypothetical protein
LITHTAVAVATALSAPISMSACIYPYMLKSQRVFKWWKNLGFVTVAYFVVTW